MITFPASQTRSAIATSWKSTPLFQRGLSKIFWKSKFERKETE